MRGLRGRQAGRRARPARPATLCPLPSHSPDPVAQIAAHVSRLWSPSPCCPAATAWRRAGLVGAVINGLVAAAWFLSLGVALRVHRPALADWAAYFRFGNLLG